MPRYPSNEPLSGDFFLSKYHSWYGLIECAIEIDASTVRVIKLDDLHCFKEWPIGKIENIEPVQLCQEFVVVVKRSALFRRHFRFESAVRSQLIARFVAMGAQALQRQFLAFPSRQFACLALHPDDSNRSGYLSIEGIDLVFRDMSANPLSRLPIVYVAEMGCTTAFPDGIFFARRYPGQHFLFRCHKRDVLLKQISEVARVLGTDVFMTTNALDVDFLLETANNSLRDPCIFSVEAIKLQGYNSGIKRKLVIQQHALVETDYLMHEALSHRLVDLLSIVTSSSDHQLLILRYRHHQTTAYRMLCNTQFINVLLLVCKSEGVNHVLLQQDQDDASELLFYPQLDVLASKVIARTLLERIALCENYTIVEKAPGSMAHGSKRDQVHRPNQRNNSLSVLPDEVFTSAQYHGSIQTNKKRRASLPSSMNENPKKSNESVDVRLNIARATEDLAHNIPLDFGVENCNQDLVNLCIERVGAYVVHLVMDGEQTHEKALATGLQVLVHLFHSSAAILPESMMLPLLDAVTIILESGSFVTSYWCQLLLQRLLDTKSHENTKNVQAKMLARKILLHPTRETNLIEVLVGMLPHCSHSSNGSNGCSTTNSSDCSITHTSCWGSSRGFQSCKSNDGYSLSRQLTWNQEMKRRQQRVRGTNEVDSIGAFEVLFTLHALLVFVRDLEREMCNSSVRWQRLKDQHRKTVCFLLTSEEALIASKRTLVKGLLLRNAFVLDMALLSRRLFFDTQVLVELISFAFEEAQNNFGEYASALNDSSPPSNEKQDRYGSSWNERREYAISSVSGSGSVPLLVSKQDCTLINKLSEIDSFLIRMRETDDCAMESVTRCTYSGMQCFDMLEETSADGRNGESDDDYCDFPVQQLDCVVSAPFLNRERTLEDRSIHCDACICCNDVCHQVECFRCLRKREQLLQLGEVEHRRYYSSCEVARHHTMESCWIIIKERVFDVTNFLINHPGGSTTLVNAAQSGMDCAPFFDHHSRQTRRILDSFYIGQFYLCEKRTVLL